MAGYNDPYDQNTYSYNPEEKIEITTGRDILSLTLSTKLGQGAFGVVFKAKDERGKYFAVKKIKIESQDPQSCYAVAQEIHILTELNHDNIVKMHAFDFLHSSAVFVMEYCEFGTLNSRLSKEVSEETKLLWLIQLASGLNYLHNHDIVHRDLKCENILLAEENCLKITDFGISRQFVCSGGNYDKTDNGYISEYLNAYMGTFAGTPFWVAPEVFDLKYNEAADIFSLGAIYYSILEQHATVFNNTKYYGLFSPYHGEDVGIGLIMSETKKQIIPKFDKTHRCHLVELVEEMVKMNSIDRPGIDVVYATVNDVYKDYLTEDDKDEYDSYDEGQYDEGFCSFQ